jgi:hypothetical protein
VTASMGQRGLMRRMSDGMRPTRWTCALKLLV